MVYFGWRRHNPISAFGDDLELDLATPVAGPPAPRDDLNEVLARFWVVFLF